MTITVDSGVLDTDTARKLVAYIERIERMDEERTSMGEDIKNEFLAAKSEGFDTKIMKVILKLRKRTADDIQEEEALVEAYRSALGML